MGLINKKYIELNNSELVNISGGCSNMSFFEKVGCGIAKIVNYIESEDRQVDFNHARNGGWQQ